MGDIFFCSDHHFNHKNILKFGVRGKMFSTVEEHNEFIVEEHNKVVTKNDKVFMLGDLCFGADSLKYVKRMNGNKTLILGNHDKQSMNSYAPIFGANDIKGAVVFNKGVHPIMLTHIPIHPMQLEFKYKANGHGHTHSHTVIKGGCQCYEPVKDPRYINFSLEAINFRPISLDEVNDKLREL